MRIILAGIGMGAREQMTQAVQEACMNADIIFGAAKVLETQSELLQYVRKHEITDADIITMQVSRSETVAGYHMMRGENPIMIGSF